MHGKIAVVTALRDCTDPATWWPHVDEATRALAAGGLVVLPTDTVYGIAADAFRPEAVQALLDAKGRGRQMPPPVLIGDVRTLDGLADDVPDEVRELVTRHWPGPLTVILKAQPSLQWDLGETRGTVALRMPDHELALAVLRRTGPLAVSSANTTGSPAATTAAAAEEMLGRSVRVYLDAGDSPGGVASTIVDATGPQLRILREGALSAKDLGISVEESAPEETGADETGADETGTDETGGSETETSESGTGAVEAATTRTRPAARKKPATADAPGDGEAPSVPVPPSAPAAKPRRTRTTAARTAAADAATAADEPVVKPRRARAPKPVATDADMAAGSISSIASVEGSGAAAPAGSEPVTDAKPKPARKPRARKPAAQPATDQPATDQDGAADEAPEGAVEAAPPKPARTPRARKPKPAPAAAPEPSAQEPPRTDEQPPEAPAP